MLGNDILIGKRNILKRVGDKVITMSLQQEKRKQVTSERQKVICTKKKIMKLEKNER